MKTKYFNRLILVLLALVTTLVMSCDESTEEPEPEGCELCPNEDGWFVYGTNTISSSPAGAEAKMSLAAAEPWVEKAAGTAPGIYGKWMYIGANSTLSFAKVESGEGAIYGAPGGGALTPGNDAGSDMTDELIFGQLTEDSDAINITNEGLYYVLLNDNEGTFTILEVKANIIGDATPGQWSEGTALPMKSVSASTAVFEATDVDMLGASGYRFRFGNGWHVYAGDPVKTVHSLGVLDYATSWEAAAAGDPVEVGYYEDNTPFVNPGVYTITLTYTAADGSWSQSFEKTGDLLADYSTVEVGYNGNAFYVDGEAPTGWSTHYDNKTPTVADDIHSWKWTTQFVENGAFAMVDVAETIWIVWDGVGRTGSAFEDEQIVQEFYEDALTQNFSVAVAGTYDVTFNIYPDGGRELNIVPHVE